MGIVTGVLIGALQHFLELNYHFVSKSKIRIVDKLHTSFNIFSFFYLHIAQNKLFNNFKVLGIVSLVLLW